jgi:hypothetical protein
MYGQHVMCRRDRAGTFYGEIDGLKAVFGAPDLETCNKWAFDLIRATNKAFGLTRDGTLPPPGAIGERHTMAGRARRAEQERRKKEKG